GENRTTFAQTEFLLILSRVSRWLVALALWYTICATTRSYGIDMRSRRSIRNCPTPSLPGRTAPELLCRSGGPQDWTLKKWSARVMLRRRLPLAIIAAVAAGFGGDGAQAQTWPQKPVRIVVPYAAGGNSDGMARITAQRLTEAFGHSFVIENRLGANGAIAAEAVAHAPGDGYTLLWGATPPITINPA